MERRSRVPHHRLRLRLHLLLLLLLSLSSSVIVASGARSRRHEEMAKGFITMCDGDASGSVSRQELDACLPQLSSASSRLPPPETFMRLLDVDGDGEVSAGEYMVILEDPQDVTLETRDGSRRKISRRELSELLEQSEARRAKMDALVREQQGGGSPPETKRQSMDEVASQNPEMARFIAVVKWAADGLREKGYPVGDMVQIKTLPAGGSNFRHGHPQQQQQQQQQQNKSKSKGADIELELGDWSGTSHADFWIEFCAKDSGAGAGAEEEARRYYEVYIERNPAIYRRPYLAIKGAWELTLEGKRMAELSVPKPRMSRNPVGHGEINQDEGEFYWSAIFPVIGLAILCFFSLRSFFAEWLEVRRIKQALAAQKKDD